MPLVTRLEIHKFAIKYKTIKKMKKIAYSCWIVTSIIFCSCGGNDTNVQSEIDSLRIELAQKTAELEMANDFVDLYNTNIDSVLKSENLVMTSIESPAITKQKIKSNIDAYNEVINRQKKRISELEELLKTSDSNSAKNIKEAIAKMQKELDRKNAEIAELRRQLDNKNVSIAKLEKNIEGLKDDIDALNEENKMQEEALIKQTELLNDAYYIIGSSKELKSKGVLSGGFLKKSKVNANELDKSIFTKIDMRKEKTFNIPSKDPKVMSQMPSNSYTITKQDDGTSVLTITDVERFWSQTIYLIVKY